MILKLVSITFSYEICNMEFCRDRATFTQKSNFNNNDNNNKSFSFSLTAFDSAGVFLLKVDFKCNFPSVNKIEAIYGRSLVQVKFKPLSNI